ncbi:hypothetical protein Rsub_04062 [Raphidocelis subcapitata]|uniref:Uncharacterized protein n=1 Tax=Raphidocelis subcapitata TaxID=307507 RepID=A0A2V0NVT5_9CHLO|nr:hypothetical protein Rsub_04062 [Raphidocelis subcapitata]|eukprot:GBF91758.1 hypothetical protein Rsub_04062 [Raphidocelis subcapitata]
MPGRPGIGSRSVRPPVAASSGQRSLGSLAASSSSSGSSGSRPPRRVAPAAPVAAPVWWGARERPTACTLGALPCSGGSCGGDLERSAGVASTSGSSAASGGHAPHRFGRAAPPLPRRRVAAAAAGKQPGGGDGPKDGGGGGKKPGGGGGGGGGGGKGSGKGGTQKPGKGAADDKADPNKADFSAYWSLRFREFFSGRRQYLELARKRQEPPEALQKIDAQIAEQRARLEDATEGKRVMRLQKYTAEIAAEAAASAENAPPELREQLLAAAARGELPDEPTRMAADVDAARAYVRSPAVKIAAITSVQLRAAARALVNAPFALPAAAAAAWGELFAAQRYKAFLLAEGERVWFWRNRTENERWFWEVFFLDRLVIPPLFTLCYLYVVPDHLIWAVALPFLAIYWQDRRLPTPANVQWWLIMVFGLYGKCWGQVTAALAWAFQWW